MDQKFQSDLNFVEQICVRINIMANVTNVSQSVIDGLLRERQDKLDADRMAKELWMKSEEALKEFAKNYFINESFLKYILKLLNIF